MHDSDAHAAAQQPITLIKRQHQQHVLSARFELHAYAHVVDAS
jgi:hypothetical protein